MFVGKTYSISTAVSVALPLHCSVHFRCLRSRSRVLLWFSNRLLCSGRQCVGARQSNLIQEINSYCRLRILNYSKPCCHKQLREDCV